MSKYGILFNVDKCIACQTCFVACNLKVVESPHESSLEMSFPIKIP